MSIKWSSQELTKLKRALSKKPSWMTENDFSNHMVGQFNKSNESIRWQLRQMRRETEKNSPPKIALLDIETLPLEGKFWGTWKQNIHPYQIKKDWSIVCWSAKWLFDSNVMGEVVTPKEAQNRKEFSVLGGIWDIMNEADIVITHNGDDFDIKKLNTKFLVNGFPPPMYYKSIDTLKTLTKNFSFTYNKLDEVNKTLGIGRKIETSWRWWDECSSGNEFYLNKMLEYNKQDVNVLEELYLKLRPWMPSHPNLALFAIDKKVSHCPACGSDNIHWSGKYSTPLGLYEAFRCQDCGAIGRSTKKQHKLASSISQN